MEAISNAGSAIGILARDGVVLVGEKKVNSKLFHTSRSTEKMYKIEDEKKSCLLPSVIYILLNKNNNNTLMVPFFRSCS
ncbi:putative proteasome endopeptidase complex [Dioscorea sansibarensis]